MKTTTQIRNHGAQVGEIIWVIQDENPWGSVNGPFRVTELIHGCSITDEKIVCVDGHGQEWFAEVWRESIFFSLKEAERHSRACNEVRKRQQEAFDCSLGELP